MMTVHCWCATPKAGNDEAGNLFPCLFRTVKSPSMNFAPYVFRRSNSFSGLVEEKHVCQKKQPIWILFKSILFHNTYYTCSMNIGPSVQLLFPEIINEIIFDNMYMSKINQEPQMLAGGRSYCLGVGSWNAKNIQRGNCFKYLFNV